MGVGVSAGGAEACAELLSHLPKHPGIAIVIVEHPDPRHAGLPPDRLSRAARLPLLRPEESTRVQPDRIYLASPGAGLLIRDGILDLAPHAAGPERYRPIDRFLRSLAQDRRGNCIGVVLSGNASDGTLGLAAIKSEGGITFAQDATAAFDSMPRSAVAAGVVDFVLPPKIIARELSEIAHHPWAYHWNGFPVLDDAGFEKLLRIVRDYTGVDFSGYRRPVVERRVVRRMLVEKCADLSRYLKILERHPARVNVLFEDLLVTVTEFFRDPDVFEALKNVGFPSAVKDRNGEPVRIWVPGCATGEEVYSIAICLSEYLQAAGEDVPFQIFGTDVSNAAITKARLGTYTASAVANVSPERLCRFFQKLDSGFQVSRAIRKSCVFSRHDVVSETPLGHMDLISCRNLLNSLERGLQSKLARICRHALKPGGCLVLGPSEDAADLDEGLVPVDRKHRIYCRRTESARPAFDLPPRAASLPPAAPPEPSSPPCGSLQAYAERVLLKQYAPRGLLVDRDLRVVDLLGDVEPYLGPAAKADMLESLPDGLILHLRGALEEAGKTGAGIRLERVRLRAGRPPCIDIVVTPITPPGAERHFLLLFEERAQRSRARRAAPGARAGLPRLAQLEDELQSTRSYLQSVIEQLRSANEEIQASNEELLATNQELQTAKEELQASNEELTSLNDEMEGRNTELLQVNNDLRNLLSSMRIPILMLGDDLRIRRYTPASEKILNLLPTDIGRPLSDLKLRIDLPDLEQVGRQVIATLTPYEQEVQDVEGRWYVLRILPYRTAENRIDGAVVQLLDIDQLKHGLEQIRHARDYAEAIVDTIREPLLVLDRELRVLTANPSFHETFRIEPGEAVGRGIYEIGRRQWDFPRMRELLDEMLRSRDHARDIELEHTFDSLGLRVLQLNARCIEQGAGAGLILLALQDVTDRKRAAEARYRQLFESARDGIVIVDAASGEIADMNPFALEIFGYSREELLGKKFSGLEALRETPGAQSALEQVRARGVVPFATWSLESRDGRKINAEVIGSAYREAGRAMVQFNIRDVTERSRFEKQIQHTQKLESLGLLAGGIAHDFNNLLTGIMGNASLGVVETPPEVKSRRYFREIIRSSERAADLTRQMLAYAGKGRFVIKPLDVSSLVSDIGSLIRTSIPKQVYVRLDLAPDLPAVDADSAQLQQLIMNLVINAAEAIGEQPGILTVRTGVREIGADFVQEYPPEGSIRPGAYVCIEVSDTGLGMDEATKARIFDPFFTTKFTGRGLGLAAAIGIVRSHKGAMRVFSVPGQGSTFEVFLPLSQMQAAGPQPRILGNLRGSGTILFVDDEDLLRGLARNALELYGYDVLLAENGKVAVDLFRENSDRVSLVVLDMTMPVMGGGAALDRIKAIRSDVPVILSSGYDETEATAKFAGKDLAAFIQKPYPIEKLLQCLADVLRPPGSQSVKKTPSAVILHTIPGGNNA